MGRIKNIVDLSNYFCVGFLWNINGADMEQMEDNEQFVTKECTELMDDCYKAKVEQAGDLYYLHWEVNYC